MCNMYQPERLMFITRKYNNLNRARKQNQLRPHYLNEIPRCGTHENATTAFKVFCIFCIAKTSFLKHCTFIRKDERFSQKFIYIKNFIRRFNFFHE